MLTNEKKYVAAYCRVSTDREDQSNSFESQKRFFRTYIEQNPEWLLYEIYADEGITGTNVKKREAFKRMIADAKDGKFELILTKEISRFARNILDSISYTRALKRWGVGVYFLNDHIDTRDGDAELRLAILSSIAQEESRRTSERVKWGQKRRMEEGVVFGHSLLGYDVKGGKLYINEDGAKTVRWIFDAFTEEGLGASAIAKALEKRGIKPKKAEIWSPSVMIRILKNEKYCGDLIQKKTRTPDYLSHEKKYNHGEEDFVVLRNHHEAIISRAQYERAQLLLEKRSEERIFQKQSERYPFSGKIRCGICGKHLLARVQERKNGTYHLWRCAGSHVSCSVNNDDVFSMMRCILKRYEAEFENAKESVLKKISAFIEVHEEAPQKTSAAQRLLELYLIGEISKEKYFSLKPKFYDGISQMSVIRETLDMAFENEIFFRELLACVTVYDTDCEIRLRALKEVFVFRFLPKGNRRQIDLNSVQIKKGNDSLLFSARIDTEGNL